MKARSKRLMLVGGGRPPLFAAVALVLSAFQQNLVFFHTPTEVSGARRPPARPSRIGGMVEDGSINAGRRCHRTLRDHRHRQGHPGDLQRGTPDLFKGGQGRGGAGQLEGGVFRATEVLAKHDEHMPPEMPTPWNRPCSPRP